MVSDLVNELRQHIAGADFQSLMDQAAGAIERQAKNLRDCRNELVYLPYRLAHDRVKTARYSQFSGKWYIGDFCAVSREKPIAWTWLPEPPEEETE